MDMDNWSLFAWSNPSLCFFLCLPSSGGEPFLLPYSFLVMAPPPRLHLLLLLFLLLLSTQVYAESSIHENSNRSADSPKRSCADKVTCQPGILLPVWLPLDPSLGMQTLRAVIYFSALLYMFLGVSIIADRFMAAIEVITSQVRRQQFESTPIHFF